MPQPRIPVQACLGHLSSSPMEVFRCTGKGARALLVCTAFVGVALVQAEELRFPPDSGMLSAADFGATPDDDTDDTQALQKAVIEAISCWPRKLVYLPTGTYLVSDTWDSRTPDESGKLTWQCSMVVIGQNREQTIIKLKDRCPGFGDPANPKAVISAGSQGRTKNSNGGGNQAFGNLFRNFTVDVGTGNPGAIGIDYMASNFGSVIDVTIRTSDPQGAGAIGISMLRDWPGPALIKRVEISGFDIGIAVGHPQYSMTFEHITLKNQLKIAFRNDDNQCVIRGLTSVNSVPAIVSLGQHGLNRVVLLDSSLTGGSMATTAIAGSGEKSYLFARNVTIGGYGKMVDWNGTSTTGSKIDEYITAPVQALHAHSGRSLSIPIRETPTYHTNDFSAWVKVDGLDSEAIQKAIDATIGTDKTVVYFPSTVAKGARRGPTYAMTKTIIVRGNVRKFMGFGVEIKTAKGFDPHTPGWIIEDGKEAVTWEHFRVFEGNFVQNSTRDMAIRFSGVGSPPPGNEAWAANSLSNTSKGTGAMFLEDCMAEPTVNPGGTLFARGLNCEYGFDPLLENHGGTMWILGFKDEVGKPSVPVLFNGPGAKTEILGFFHHALDWQKEAPAIVNDGGTLSVAGFTYSYKANDVTVKERQGTGEWKTLLCKDPAKPDYLKRFPLYLAFPSVAKPAGR